MDMACTYPITPATSTPVLDVPRVVKLEQTIASQGTSLAQLMERAGTCLAQTVMNEAAKMSQTRAHSLQAQAASDQISSETRPARILILCGYGNNGGDGWVAARVLADAGFSLTLVSPVPAQDLKAQPAQQAALESQLVLEACHHAQLLIAPSTDALQAACEEADIIVDAILGTGFSGDAVRAPFDEWILLANAQRTRGARIVAADVPSGLSAQTGKAATPCVKANITLTMICLKPGLVTPYAFAFCGDVLVARIAAIDAILQEWAHEEAQSKASRPEAAAPNATRKENGRPSASAKTAVKKDEFHRPEAEDDDGYDPYSDRRPEPEPLFQSDPWS